LGLQAFSQARAVTIVALTDQEFRKFQHFIFEAAGISVARGKEALVAGRLAKRLQHHHLVSYGQYFKLLRSKKAAAEVQTAVDLLTTNETYFLREAKHFELLKEIALEARQRRQTLRVWSAACSTGEEVYSIAMVLADALGDGAWGVLGSDISQRVLAAAQSGHYPDSRTQQIPKTYLKRFCLRGIDSQHGTVLINPELRSRVQFTQLNLNSALPNVGMFDLIFLRNVMIYFSADSKRQLVQRLLTHLKPGGRFLIGHSDSLHEISDAVKMIKPSVYV
jgi:chemotaxis protein methyltransferase CheR